MGAQCCKFREEDPLDFVLLQWQRDRKPSCIFLIFRLIFAFYFLSAFIIIATSINVTIKYKEAYIDQIIPRSLGLYTLVPLSVTNRFLIISAIFAYICCIIQQFWATIALALAVFSMENAEGVLRLHPIYVVTMKISYDFSFMLLVSYWSAFDIFKDVGEKDRRRYGLTSDVSCHCFVLFFTLLLVDFVLIKQRIKLAHWWISVVPATVIALIVITITLVKDRKISVCHHDLGSNFKWSRISHAVSDELKHDGKNEDLHHCAMEIYKEAQEYDIYPNIFNGVPVFIAYGVPYYLLGVVYCICSHFLFILLQGVKNIVKNKPNISG